MGSEPVAGSGLLDRLKSVLQLGNQKGDVPLPENQSVEPEQVIVETWRPDESWLLRLLPDHSYELERGADRSGSGTIVALRKTMTEDDRDETKKEIQELTKKYEAQANDLAKAKETEVMDD